METSNGTQPTLNGTPKRIVDDEARQSNSANKANGPSDTSTSDEVSHNDGAANTVPTVTPLAKRTQTDVQTVLPGRDVAESTAYTLPTVQGDQEAKGIQTETRKLTVNPLNTLLFITTASNGQINMGDTNCAKPSKEKIMGIIKHLCNKQDRGDVRAIENSMIAMYICEIAENKDIEQKVRDENTCPHFPH